MQAVIKALNGEMVMSLSDDILEALGLKSGDTVKFDVSNDGSVKLESADGLRAVRLKRGRDFMNRYKETLDILAR